MRTVVLEAAAGAIEPVQTLGAIGNPELAVAQFEHAVHGVARRAARVGRIVAVMAKAGAAGATFVQAGVECTDPQRTGAVVVDEQDTVARQAGWIFRVMPQMFEAAAIALQAIEAAAHRRDPETAIARTRDVLNEIVRQRICASRIMLVVAQYLPGKVQVQQPAARRDTGPQRTGIRTDRQRRLQRHDLRSFGHAIDQGERPHARIVHAEAVGPRSGNQQAVAFPHQGRQPVRRNRVAARGIVLEAREALVLRIEPRQAVAVTTDPQTAVIVGEKGAQLVVVQGRGGVGLFVMTIMVHEFAGAVEPVQSRRGSGNPQVAIGRLRQRLHIERLLLADAHFVHRPRVRIGSIQALGGADPDAAVAGLQHRAHHAQARGLGDRRVDEPLVLSIDPLQPADAVRHPDAPAAIAQQCRHQARSVGVGGIRRLVGDEMVERRIVTVQSAGLRADPDAAIRIGKQSPDVVVRQRRRIVAIMLVDAEAVTV